MYTFIDHLGVLVGLTVLPRWHYIFRLYIETNGRILLQFRCCFRTYSVPYS